MDRMLDKIQQRGWAWPFGVASTVAMFVCWGWIYQALRHIPVFGSSDVLLIVHPAILVTSTMVHEFGHAAMYRRAGFRPMVFSFMIGGGAYVPDRLWKPWHKTASLSQEVPIILGGVLANLAVLLLAWPLEAYVPLHRWADALVYINAWMIVTNLIPIPGFDGSRFWQCLIGRQANHDFSRLADRAWFGVYAGLIIIGWRVISTHPYL